MALIGQIAISMVADANNFNRGLLGASASIKAFEKSAVGNITKGSKFVSMGLSNINKGITDLATGMGKRAGYGFAELVKGANQFYGGLATVAVGLGKLGLSYAVRGFQMLADVVGSTVHFVADLAKTTLFLGVVLGGLAAYALWDVAKGAITLGEQSDRARIVFGKFADLVTDEAKLMAGAFGVARKEFIQSASAFGTIFQGVGYTQEAAAQLSVHFVKLATDLSSLVHIPVEEAMAKIQSGLAGQVRPLREVGVFMSEEQIQVKAVAMGLARLGAELTESQKVQARIAFITEKLGIAQGNLALTADSAGNAVRSLSGRFENLKDSIGTALLGILVPALEDVNAGIMALQMAWDASAIGAASATAGVLGGSKSQVKEIGFIQSAVMKMADGWQSFKVIMLQVAVTMTRSINIMLASLQGFVGAIPGAKSLFGNAFDDMAGKVDKLNTEAIKSLHAEMGKAAPSKAIAEAFEKARTEIQAKRTELAAKPPLDVTKLAPVSEAAKMSDLKFASSSSLGSKESTNMQLRSRYGAGVAASKAPEKTAENTAKAASSLEQIKNMLARQAANPAVGLPMIEIQ